MTLALSAAMTERIRWRRADDGMVWIAEPPNYAEYAPSLDDAGRKRMADIERDWGSLCREKGGPLGVPDGWLQAMIYRESGGNKKAFRKEPNGWTGVGLLQITSPALKKGKPDEVVFVPAVNIELGAAYVAYQMSRYGKDFPKVAAAFNAGSVRETGANPWGMVHTTGHVMAEVRALNTWLALRYADKFRPEPAPLIDLTEMAREEDARARAERLAELPEDDGKAVKV